MKTITTKAAFLLHLLNEEEVPGTSGAGAPLAMDSIPAMDASHPGVDKSCKAHDSVGKGPHPIFWLGYPGIWGGHYAQYPLNAKGKKAAKKKKKHKLLTDKDNK